MEVLSSNHLLELAKYGLLRKYLKEKVVDDAIADVALTPDEQAKSIELFLARNNLKDQAAFERFCHDNLFEVDCGIVLAERPLRIRKYSLSTYRSKAESRFLERKADLDQVVYGLIRTRSEELARELYFRLDDGDVSFPDLAAEHSEGSERNSFGVVGPTSISSAHPLLAERLRVVPLGVVQEPFMVDKWWILMNVTQRISACFDEPTSERMCLELFDEWIQAEISAKLDLIRSSL